MNDTADEIQPCNNPEPCADHPRVMPRAVDHVRTVVEAYEAAVAVAVESGERTEFALAAATARAGAAEALLRERVGDADPIRYDSDRDMHACDDCGAVAWIADDSGVYVLLEGHAADCWHVRARALLASTAAATP